MPKPCGICNSSQREQIDTALLSGTPIREVARRFNLSKTRVHAHRQKCIREAIVKASEGRQVEKGNQLLAQIRNLQRKTLAALAQAEEVSDLRGLLACVREARENLELEGKLLGQIGTAPRVGTLNVANVRVVYEDQRREEPREIV